MSTHYHGSKLMPLMLQMFVDTNVYHPFFDGYSQIAVSLTRLTKKDVPFKWMTVFLEAFDTPRTSFMQIAMPCYLKQGRGFLLDTNTSQHNIGTPLSHLDEQGKENPPCLCIQTVVHDLAMVLYDVEVIHH